MRDRSTPTLAELYRLDEMARHREEPMWAALDFAATSGGEFTIRDMFNVWARAGGGNDNASYQQFSTAINNYIYKYDPQSPTAKYRNPRYKYIRVGKTDKGTVPAPLEYVARGTRGAGNAAKLRWRQGIPPMRQPAPPKAPIHSEDDPMGDALDRLEKRLGRPALKASLARWRQMGDLHRISQAIMDDSQIRGKDKMLALQVAADHLVRSGRATQAQASRAEGEMEDEVGGGQGAPSPTDFDEEEPTNPDATPFGASQGPADGDDEEMPDDLLHGDDDGGDGEEGPTAPESDEPAAPEEAPPGEGDAGEAPSEEDGPMRGTLVDEDGNRVEVTIQYDEEEGALVTDGERMYEPEDYDLHVANGVLSQEAFDALEGEGWNLVAADQGDEEGGAGAEAPDEDEGGEEGPAGTEGGEEPGDVGDPEEGDFPAFVPEPDEGGDRYERAMFVLVDEGDQLEPKRCREDDPLWGQLRKARDAADAHQVILRSGLPKGMHKYALTVARAIFDNTGRDFDTGKAKNESRLLSLYGLRESPLQEPVDFEQTQGLERLYRVRRAGA